MHILDWIIIQCGFYIVLVWTGDYEVFIRSFAPLSYYLAPLHSGRIIHQFSALKFFTILWHQRQQKNLITWNINQYVTRLGTFTHFLLFQIQYIVRDLHWNTKPSGRPISFFSYWQIPIMTDKFKFLIGRYR